MANRETPKAKLNCFNKRQWKALVLAFELYATEQNVLESESQTDKAKLSDLINVPFVEYVHDKVFRAFHSHITELTTFEHKASNGAKLTHFASLHDDKMSENNDLDATNNTTLTKSQMPAKLPEQEERHGTSKYISMLLQFLFSNKESECNSISTENSPLWAELDLRQLTENEINLLALCYRTQIKMQAYYNKLVSNNTKLHDTKKYCFDNCHDNTNTATELDLYEVNNNELEKPNGIDQECDQRRRTKDKTYKTNKFSKQEVKHGYSSKVNNKLLENRTSNIYSDDKLFVTDVDDAAESTMSSPEKKNIQEDFAWKTEVDRHKCDTTHNLFQSNVLQEEPICQVCYESGGDLYLCSQCKRWMHEICGGPHPPEANSSLSNSRNNKKSGKYVIQLESNNYNSLTNLCKQCRVEMRITSSSSSSSSESSEDEECECESTSSLTEKKLRTKRNGKKKKEKRKRRSDSQCSSSLRSTTSSSERAEIDAYFGTDDDSDTSLSGFIVRSSEDEDNEEEEELEQQHKQGYQSKEEKRIKDMRSKARDEKENHNKRVRDATSAEQTRPSSSSSSSSVSSIAPLSTQSSLEMADDIL